jgi:pimeloyl-ACP methyl ester carboxylesterase
MIEDQWNIIHLPERPNGFGVMIIGDTNHYVDKGISLWTQNSDRKHLIDDLLQRGYTVFYSNLFGRNWGSPKALDVCIKLYHFVINNEILNKKIHLLVEGMGGILALRLLDTLKDNLRSVAMINPCLYLTAHVDREKANKLFYKRLKREISTAYEISEKEVENLLKQKDFQCDKEINIPAKIWHAASGSKYNVKDHSRCYEAFRKKHGHPIDLSLHLLEGRFTFSKQIAQFYKEQEKVL